MSSREEFETWYRKNICSWSNLSIDSDGEYFGQMARTAWKSWQASRQALELQLSTRYSDHYAPDGISSQSARVHDAAVTACMDLIAQQGIRCRA